MVLPIDRVDRAVLDMPVGDVLSPAIVRAVLDGVFDALAPATVSTTVDVLRAELKALDKKIGNLTAAVEGGAVVAPLVAKLAERQAQRED